MIEKDGHSAENGAGAPNDGDGVRPRFEEDVDFWTTLAIVLEKRRLALKVGGAIFALGFVWILLAKPTFTSSASFFPQQTGSTSAQLEGLAARFGVNVPGAGTTQGPQFYSQLLQSRRILGDLVHKVHARPADGGPPLELADVLLEERPDRPDEVEEETIKAIRERLSVEISRNTDVVSFGIKAPTAELAKTMADTLIALVKTFNVSIRQNQAAEERRFAETRLGQAQAELGAAEADLQAFLEQNRQFQNSPQLTFEHDRLQRAVEMRQGVVTSLAQSLEQAKLEEVRSTPLITVLEAPQVPVKADPRGRLKKLVLLLLLAFGAGVVAALVSAVFEPRGERDSHARIRVQRAYREIGGELRSVFARRRPAAVGDRADTD